MNKKSTKLRPKESSSKLLKRASMVAHKSLQFLRMFQNESSMRMAIIHRLQTTSVIWAFKDCLYAQESLFSPGFVVWPVLAFVSYCWFFIHKTLVIYPYTQKNKKKKQTIADLQMQRRMGTVNERDKYLQGKKIIITTNRDFDILCVDQIIRFFFFFNSFFILFF